MCILVLVLMGCLYHAGAQTNFSIYSDQLDNGFQNWSWNGGDNNFANTSPLHSGNNSIAFTGGAWEAISVWHPTFNPAPFTNLSFWINSGGAGGQIIQIYAEYGTNSATAYRLPALPADTNWLQYNISFSALHIAGVTNFNRISFQLTSSGTASPFYLDDIDFVAAPPATVHLTVDASQTGRLADARWFGLNTAIWDSNFDTPTTAEALSELGTRILRYPGGSASDEYHWATDRSGTNTWSWSTSFANFTHVATNVGAQAMITVNYGTGTSDEAAAWVRAANVTNHFGFKYWEIGNECYGGWETDSNNPSLPHDPYTYAVRASDYIAKMKAVDPTIKIGVVAVPGESSYSNNATHFAVNPRTGTTNYGWTPVMLATLNSLGATPDFLIHHVYPEFNVDNDQSLLMESGNWAGDAGSLRQEVTDYLGSAGTNTELICTENNSDAGDPGRQSTSIVNGLYLADSLAQLMKTEFNGFIWWDLRNGTDTNGDFAPSLYGWRNYGDLGVINGLNTRHPVYYAFKLMHYLAQPGDTILNPSSDYGLLTTYGSRKADGSLVMLVVNKDRYSTYSAQLRWTNYLAWTNALVRSFGIAQDEAARTNSVVPGAQDIATNNLAVTSTNVTTAFPPYSITLLTIPPAAPQLAVQASSGGAFSIQLQGQPKVRYVLQSSTNFSNWTPEATNTLMGSTWNFSANVLRSQKFWRAVWLAQ